MRIKTLARGLTLFVALAVALTVMAAPAVAAEPKAVASIATRTFLAGTAEAPIAVTVSNVPDPTLGPTTAAPNINWVTIAPPPGHYTALPVFQTPPGWSARLTHDGMFRFTTSTNPILPGGSLAFTGIASVSRPTVDVSRNWIVTVSGNGGATNTRATADPSASDDPLAPNALTTTIRVLQVLSTKITSPLGATDNTVTSGQTTDVQLEVLNAGSGTLNVTPDITTSRPSGSTATATDTCPAAQPIAPGARATFTCQVNFQRGTGSGGITLRGNASGSHADGNATALTSSTPQILVMTAAAFTYASQSLQPTEVSPGRAFIFRLGVSKTGEVAVNLDKANTTLSFGPASNPTLFTATLNEPAVVPAGGTAATPVNVLLEFKSTTVPLGMPANDGTGKQEYTPTLTIKGADQNDFGVSQSPSVTDKILVDALGPIINAAATPPPSRVVGEPDATTNGARVSFSGDISDRGARCGACPVTAVVRQYNAAGTPVGTDIPVTISNNQGTLSGSFSGNYDPLAVFMDLVVIGADPGGNATTARSNLVPVDNVLPVVARALTGSDVMVNEEGEDVRVNRRIDVFISEPVAGAVAASDFDVDGHRVVSAEPVGERNGRPASRANFTQVRLTVDPELGRNEETNVTYAPTAGSRANDRVGLLIPNATVLAVDGIVPRLPEVLAISGMEKQEDDNGDERYYSNDDTPAITVEIDPGDTVVIYEDKNGNGEVDEGTDTEVCRRKAFADETTVVCTASSLGTTGRDLNLLFRSFDTRLNVGPVALEPLTLDFLRPTIQSLQFIGTDIEVSFNESMTELRNSNFSDDWRVAGKDGGFDVIWTPGRVEGEGAKRTLRGDSSYWSAPGNRAIEVRYRFDATDTPHDRYADRAGNELLDQNVLVR